MITSIRLLAVLAFVPPLIAGGCGGGEEQSRPSESPRSNEAEDAFLEAMVPHHESAIQVGKLAVKRAETKEIRALAKDIVSAQQAEIAQIGSIHERLIGTPIDPDEGAHEVLGLSAEEAGMDHGDAAAALRTAEPFDRAFIDHMVPHHQGAVRMARAVLPSTDDRELRALAQGIVSAQEREIEELEALREERYGESSPPEDGHQGQMDGGADGHSS
jgi:uncharacterized protein (DUF305 family)